MSAAAEGVRLRRLVWRHEHGGLSFDRARVDAVDEAYGRALDELRALEGDRAALRVLAPALLPAYEEALRGARRALDERALRAAVDHLLHLRDLRARMREVLDADAAVRSARLAVERMRAAAAHPALRALPCVDTPTRLLAAARARMAEGAWTRAAYLAHACARQADAVAPAGPADPSRAPAARATLATLRTLGAATRDLFPHPAADPCGDAVLDAAAALAGEGWTVLAERAAEELAALAAPRARFQRAREQDPDGAGAAVAELRRRLGGAAGDEDPWTAATRLLWRTRVDEGLRRMRAAPPRREVPFADGPDQPAFRPREPAPSSVPLPDPPVIHPESTP